MSCGAQKTIFVKVGRMGGRVKELCLPYGITVSDVILKSGEKYSAFEEEIYVNGRREFSMSILLHDKDIILIQKKSIVEMINVKVGRVGDELIPTTIRKYSGTVHDALVGAGLLPFDDEIIFMHDKGGPCGRIVSEQAFALEEGDVIILERKDDELRKDIYAIISSNFEDENGEWERGTKEILYVLKTKYNITKK